MFSTVTPNFFFHFFFDHLCFLGGVIEPSETEQKKRGKTKERDYYKDGDKG